MHAPVRTVDLFDPPAPAPPPTYTLWGWRYRGHDRVTYQHQTLIYGGPALAGITAIASAVGNRRRRAIARQAAQPGWQLIGLVAVSVYVDHLVISPESESPTAIWNSLIDGASITEDGHLELLARGEAPYRFSGPGAAELAQHIDRRTAAS